MAAKKNTTREAPVIHIGTEAASVKAAQAAIMSILSAPHADEETKRAALDSLRGICGVENASINNCSISG